MSKGDKKQESALNVQKGIAQPLGFNPNAAGQLKRANKGLLSPEEYLEGIKLGNRTILSKAITLVESSRHEHQKLARNIIELSLPFSGNSVRIGITGVPGVGKSTFIETLGTYLVEKGNKLAVLAIDPSSQRTRGSILGDKTRMENLANNPHAYIRPSPSAGSLGGVARKTKETIILCEAAGFDVIFIETVGVGQSETAVHSMVDIFLLLMLAGAGDELQGIKRGIMEMADMLIINKADGDNINKAKLAMKEYQNAMHLFPATESGWVPKVATCSSLRNHGIEDAWKIVEEYLELVKGNGYLQKNRKQQELKILKEFIQQSIMDDFYNDQEVKTQLLEFEKQISIGKISAYKAAADLMDLYFGKNKV